jgi:hypothetical protein
MHVGPALGSALTLSAGLALGPAPDLEAGNACQHGGAELAVDCGEVDLAVDRQCHESVLDEHHDVLRAAEQTVQVDPYDRVDLACVGVGEHPRPARSGATAPGGGGAVVNVLVDDRPAVLLRRLAQSRELAVDTVRVRLG